MKLDKVHLLLDQLESNFSDFHLDGLSQEFIEKYFKSQPDPDLELSFNDFLAMLDVIQKSGSNGDPQGIFDSIRHICLILTW